MESDADPSINSTEVFHKSAISVDDDDAACEVNKDSEEEGVDKVNPMEKQEEATFGAPDILLEGPKEQKVPEQPEGERSKCKSPGRRKSTQAAWQEEQEPVSNPATGPGGNNIFLERDTKAVSESTAETKEEQEHGNVLPANRKPSKSPEQREAEVEMKDAENEKDEK